MSAPYTGRCQCSSVRYVLATEPSRVVAFHCADCQRQSGSAFGMPTPVKKREPDSDGLTQQFTRKADSGEVTDVFCPISGVRVDHVLKSALTYFRLSSARSMTPLAPAGLLHLDEECARLGSRARRRQSAREAELGLRSPTAYPRVLLLTIQSDMFGTTAHFPNPWKGPYSTQQHVRPSPITYRMDAKGVAMTYPVVLITGALTDIGRASAVAFCQEGREAGRCRPS